ncbi:hypothetical protein [Nocardia altamirensis]|uniref:hypothetical protein n=1 Tax=Nocardia altamirensis TaxID=472158 RepID=UPI00084017DD|nr:hypothetical protein [Nocardia altamirensis]
MDEKYAVALEPVLRDLAATCAVQPVVREETHHGTDWVMFYEPEGSGVGIGPLIGDNYPEQVACLADKAQEWAVEALWATGEPAVWPLCPNHPNAHPLTAGVSRGVAVWSCPKTHTTVASIGQLSAT